jgi:adenine-specific DNA-methyltransferase
MPIHKLRPSFTFTESRLAELRAVVPEAFADGKIDWDVLREALGEYLEDEDTAAEHFGLFWPGKREARRLATVPSQGALLPQPGEGVDEDTTRNIFIEGENLEVLKLLQKSYAGQVKMIYIDPPYNTGNDFVYSDDYSEPLEAYLHRTAQSDDEGLVTSNPKSGGRYHSNWLSMMYPRLLLARQLLRPDGIIFVSIDDNEMQHLRLLMTEVFGEENFFTVIVVRSNIRGQTYKQISKTHEYVLLYTNNPDTEIKELPKQGERDDLDLADDISRYNVRELRNRNPKFGRFNRPNLFYPIYVNPSVVDSDGFSSIALQQSDGYSVEVLPLNSSGEESCWRWGRDLLRQNIGATTGTSNAVARMKTTGEYGIYEKYRKTTYKAKSIWLEKEMITERGTVQLGELGLADYFDFPKPTGLLRKLLILGTTGTDIVLDFFAGSCTTAHALLELNREDGEHRRFIAVQLPEPTESSDYPTIADIGRERIRRVIDKMDAEDEGKLPVHPEQDLGFRSFRLDRSSFRTWHDFAGQDLDALQMTFDHFETPLVEDWKEEALLVELLVVEGFPLDSEVALQEAFTHNSVHLVTSEWHEHRLLVCLDQTIDEHTIDHLQFRPEDIFVCLDSALTDQTKMRLSDRGNLHVI